MAKKKYLYRVVVVLVLINSMGFPGNYTKILGNQLRYIVDYGCFAFEIIAIFLSSGSNIKERSLIYLKKRNWAVYLLIVIFFVDSMLVSRYPNLQIITCVRFSVTVYFVLWICDSFLIDEVVELLCIAQGCFVLLTLIFALLKPDMAFTDVLNGFGGLYENKNSAGDEFSMGVTAYALFYRMCYEKKKKIPLFFNITMMLQLIMLFLTKATGAQITALFTSLIAILLRKNTHRLPLGWMFISISVGFLFIALTVMPYFSWLFEALGKDATLTGRTNNWNHMIEVMLQNKTFTGYGYAMFWKDSEALALFHAGFSRDSWFSTMTSGAHNFLLECWATVGLIGIASIFLCAVTAFVKVDKLSWEQYLCCIAMFSSFTILGLTDRAFASAYDYKVVYFFLVIGIGNLAYNQTNRRSRERNSFNEQVYQN